MGSFESDALPASRACHHGAAAAPYFLSHRPFLTRSPTPTPIFPESALLSRRDVAERVSSILIGRTGFALLP
jgi:hypothetical protein